MTEQSNSDRLSLLFWDGKKARILPQVEHHGRSYQPIELHPSLQRAIRFPRGTVEYSSPEELFAGAASLFERFIGVSVPEAASITTWTATSYFADCMSSPPALLVFSPDRAQAIRLFRLLRALCRRGLLLAGLSRSAVLSLPTLMCPSLLVIQPDLPAPVRTLWNDSSHRGVFIPVGGGAVLDIASSKAIYVGMESRPDTWSDTPFQVALPPAQSGLPQLDDRELEDIANRWQPRLLLYRLRTFRKVRNANCVGTRSLSGEIDPSLAACIDGGSAVRAATLLLQRQEQDARAQRSCDINVVLIEVVWAPSHEKKEITVRRITELTNALLRSRGQRLEFSDVELGWRLRNLGFHRHRNGQGMILQFSREHCVRIHQLARHLGLPLQAFAGCADCSPAEVVAAQ